MSPTRKIGTSTFPAIGYGSLGIASYYGAVDTDEERFKVLDAALAAGCTFWDTADMYGDSEELLGKWFKARPGKREQIFLSSKFGFVLPSFEINSTPEYAKEAVESSLKKLGVDCIDLYYVHRVDLKTPIEHTIAALAEFVKAGKIKYLGLSEISATTLRRAHAVHPIAAIQMEYSPFTLDIEDPKIGLLAAARELGATIVAYAPLGRGLATGQFRSPADFEDSDFRKMIPRFSEENFPKVLKLADGLKAIGEKYNATASQVTLAWLIAQGDDIIAIPGTKKIKYLEENMGALKVKLSPEDVKAVREIAVAADASSQRYPDFMMTHLFADSPEL
ncbi:NADP-dependent oxidoreductase domain-containing protein [Mycena epipterygia]|nr:NADP-dependent oxidoreductase domain-containing protein [Mycena epipterygia]